MRYLVQVTQSTEDKGWEDYASGETIEEARAACRRLVTVPSYIGAEVLAGARIVDTADAHRLLSEYRPEDF